MVGSASIEHAAALADEGRWKAARDAYAALLEVDNSADAHLGLARACWWSGETGRARGHAELAFAAYDREHKYADAAMVAVHLCIWHLTNFDNASAGHGWLARAREAAERSNNLTVGGWVTLLSGYFADDRSEGLRLLEAAATTAALQEDLDLATMATADLGLSHVIAGDVGRGMAMLDEAMAATLAEPRGMLEVVVWASCDMLAACSLVDDLQRATEWCRAADRFMETYGCPFLQARCRAHYGRVLVAAGRWTEAEQELERALAMAADTGRGPRTEALTALADLRQRQGRPDESLQLLDAADGTASGAAIRAASLLDLGRADDARAALRSELAVQPAEGPDYPLLAAAMAEMELAAGRLEDASALLLHDHLARNAPSYPRSAGLLARASGLLAAAQDNTESARNHLGFALDVFTRLELAYEAACTELHLAVLLRTSDVDAAIGRAHAAHRRLEAIGARQKASEASALLRALGVTPRPGRPSADALSARERDVLELVAAGLSNPAIAERLFLSRRTVGHHVSSILRKLNMSSRAEAAAFHARRSSHQ
ncbi:MAG TPA: LuxR C-terminal-related transcriptional regulator [Nocardioidaceae bacterium]|nr:LuxR C-terminal-related transcriptional regulator [Nocardioidaceae bacterium]